MAKIARKTAKIFGSTASAAQIAKFGSLAAGTPVTYSGATADPANVQALSNWLAGWFSGVEAGNSPAIEDMNAFCFVMAYQIAYQMQTGVPEWDVSTTYYKGSLVNDGTGNVYVSITDSNVGNLLSNTTNWQPMITLASGGFVSNLKIDPALAANQTITLPKIPAAQSNLQMSSAGVIKTATLGGNYQVSGSSNGFTTSSGTSVDVSGQTVTITSDGRPIMVGFCSDGSADSSFGAATASAAGCDSRFTILRSGSSSGSFFYQLLQNLGSGANQSILVPPGVINALDPQPAGTYTYKLQARINGIAQTASATNVVMYAYLVG